LLGRRELPTRDGDRLGGASECGPDNGLVLVSNQQHPDRGLVLRPPQPILNEGDIETKLTGVARLEFRGLQLDNHIPKLIDVKEHQINEEVISVDIEVDLAANKRKPRAEFAERVSDALDEPGLHLSLCSVPVDGEELERERNLRDLLSELRVGAFESVRKVRRGLHPHGSEGGS
jgi:hypothetical protein